MFRCPKFCIPAYSSEKVNNDEIKNKYTYLHQGTMNDLECKLDFAVYEILFNQIFTEDRPLSKVGNMLYPILFIEFAKPETYSLNSKRSQSSAYANILFNCGFLKKYDVPRNK
jgi:hypothetical protein